MASGNGSGSTKRKGSEPEDHEAINLAADWSDISAGLRKDLGHQLFSQWIKPIQLGGIDDETGRLDLYMPTEFSANWVNDRFADRLTLAWKIARSEIRTVKIQVHPGRRKLADLPLGDGRRPANDGMDIGSMLAGAGTTIGDSGFTSSVGLDPSLTLAAFITGETNILGFNAAQRMAATETPQFSPLYLKAATGQGKTHLLHAIGHQYLATHPRAQVGRYIHSRSPTQQFRAMVNVFISSAYIMCHNCGKQQWLGERSHTMLALQRLTHSTAALRGINRFTMALN